MQSRLAVFESNKAEQDPGKIRNSNLILFGFASAFFPRLLDTLGAPSIINFVHFGIIPLAVLITLYTTKARDQKRIQIVWQLLTGMAIFLIVMLASSILNGAGIVNISLQFMFQAEPFMLLAAMIAMPLSGQQLERFKYWVLGFALFNLLLAIAQSILLPLGIYPKPTGGTLEDNIGGVFGGGGGSAANYISCTVSFYFSVYFFNQFKNLALWMRILPLVSAIYQIQASDSKQVFLALAAGWGLLAITKVERPVRLLVYVTIFVVFVVAFGWALLNVEAEILRPYQNWIDRPIWGWDGLAIRTKLAAFRIIPTHFVSPLNWLVGLGPGHTVTRLGGWVMRDYASLLGPLGATIHPSSAEVFAVVRNTYLAQESTIYFPLFTWAGIWGDLGVVGVCAYLFICFIIWHNVCVDDFGKFMLLSTAVFGCILTQMEEPGHMLTVVCILAIRWQEHREKQLARLSLLRTQ